MSDHQHDHSHEHGEGDGERRAHFEHLIEKHGGEFGEAFWDDLYGERNQVWTGNVNRLLPELTADLTPGCALDVGCGEGADAIFLAEQGWTVTGIDITQVALDRAAREASVRGAGERTTFRKVDLTQESLDEQFDLVSAHFMHVMSGDPLTLLRGLPALVKPGGTLIVVGHAANVGHENVTGWRATDLAEGLGLDGWTIDVVANRGREGVDDPNGHLADEVFRATRSA